MELFPGVNKHLIMMGIVQIGDIPTRGNIIDLHSIQYRAQQMGITEITEDFFLICSSLQSKLKPYLGCVVQEGTFLEHLSWVAKKLLLIEYQTIVNLSGRELSLGLNIGFDEQQQAFHNMIHNCKYTKFLEVNFKMMHHILLTPCILAKMKK